MSCDKYKGGMIGLLDIDSVLPNLALMKIKAFYGEEAKMIMPLEVNIPEFVYASKIFRYSEMPVIKNDYAIGGTGIYNSIRLKKEIENCDPDYSIYPNCDFSWQRFSTGCPNNCSFCLVPEFEGKIKAVKPMKLNPNGKYIRLLDNNFFANPEWKDAINYLLNINQPVIFDGVDVRTITEEQCFELNKVKIKKQIHVAWDNPKQDLTNKFKQLLSYIKPYKISCYVLIGFDSTPDEDLNRVETLRSLKIDPFVMPFDKENEYQKRFARWVNHKAIFKTVKWKNYI